MSWQKDIVGLLVVFMSLEYLFYFLNYLNTCFDWHLKIKKERLYRSAQRLRFVEYVFNLVDDLLAIVIKESFFYLIDFLEIYF